MQPDSRFRFQFVLQVPLNFNSALTYRIVARAGNFSDGEENTIPVLSNRLLVTESLPLYMNGVGNKSFKFEKLLQSGNSASLSNYSLTVEYTANPAWYAVQSLPYLMEFPYECAEQTFSRFYANALATAIANANPGIKKVWENWKNADTAALLSNLQKNEELKSALAAGNALGNGGENGSPAKTKPRIAVQRGKNGY